MGLFGFGKRMEEETKTDSKKKKKGQSVLVEEMGVILRSQVPDVSPAMSNMKM